jgi:hypothetical protein
MEKSRVGRMKEMYLFGAKKEIGGEKIKRKERGKNK